MLTITIIWIAVGFLMGFGIYLWPRRDRPLALSMTILSFAYGIYQLLTASSLHRQLLDWFGVTLIADDLSGYLIITNALVTAAVILYCWSLGKTAFFYMQAIILHSSMNAVFISADFISLYVALEVISIAAFLLIAYPRTNRAIWIGLRYLLVSNTAMLFYLIGAVQVYQASRTFAYSGLEDAPTEAIALILLGLLTKGGIFISGLWLPMTHAEADTPVSALLSGVVITTGFFPLVRCALLVNDILPIVQLCGVATALFGVIYAIAERDSKRLLAASTISQVGFVLAAPAVAGLYTLSHGLAKASLFLLVGRLPHRQFAELRKTPLSWPIWGAMAIASLSICGMPLLPGFEAKALVLKSLDGWQAIAMNGAAVGTAIALAKFIFLPVHPLTQRANQIVDIATAEDVSKDKSSADCHSLNSPSTLNKKMKLTQKIWILSVGLLFTGLLSTNAWHHQQYTISATLKSLVTIALGWIIYHLLTANLNLILPRSFEKIEHLIGGMSLILIFLMGVMLV